jgi:hypothetical protein
VNFSKAKVADRVVIAQQVLNELAEQKLSNLYAVFAGNHKLSEEQVDALGLEVQVTTGKSFASVEEKYAILKPILDEHNQKLQGRYFADVYQRFLASLSIGTEEANALGEQAAREQGLPFVTPEERSQVLVPLFNEMRKLENLYLLLKNVHQIDRARADLLGAQDAQAYHKPFNTAAQKYEILSSLNQALSETKAEGGSALVQAAAPLVKKEKPTLAPKPAIVPKRSVAQRMADGELGSSGVYVKPKKNEVAPALPGRQTEEDFVVIETAALAAAPTKTKPPRPPLPYKPSNIELTPKEARAVEVAQAKAIAQRTENDDIYRFERSGLYEDLVRYGITREVAEGLVADLSGVKSVSSLSIKEQVDALSEVTREIRNDKLRPLYQELAKIDIGPDRANALLAKRLGAKEFNALTPGEFFQGLRAMARELLDKKNSDESIIAAAKAASQAIEKEKIKSRFHGGVGQVYNLPQTGYTKQEKENLSHNLALAAAHSSLKTRNTATIKAAPAVEPTAEPAVKPTPAPRRKTGANDLLAD